MKKIIKNCAIIFALVSLTSCQPAENDVIGGTINSNDFTHMTSMEWIAQEEVTANVAAIFEMAVEKGYIKQEELDAPNTTILCPTQYAINRFVRRHNSVNHQKEWKKFYPEATEWTIDMMTEEELQMMKMYIFPGAVIDRAALEGDDDGVELQSLPFWRTVNKPNPAYNPDDKNSKEPQYLYTPEYAEYEAAMAVYNEVKGRFDLWAAYDDAVELWNEWNTMTEEEKKDYLLQNDNVKPTEPKTPKTKDENGNEVEVVRPTQTEEQIEELRPATKPEQMYQTMVVEERQTVRLTLDPTNINGNAAYEGAGIPGVGYQYSNFLLSTPEIIHALFKRGNNWEVTPEERGKLQYEGNECDQYYCMYISDVQTSTGVVHAIYVSDITYNERLHSHTLLFYGSRADDAKL